MAKPQKAHSLGCAVFLFIPAVMFGFVFLAAPVGLLLGREGTMANEDPVRWGSMGAMILLALPHVLSLRPKPLPDNSPYLEVARPENPAEILQALQAPGEEPRLIVHYDSPQETKQIFGWLAPLATWIHLWAGLMIAGELLALAPQLAPFRWLVVLVCLLPVLNLAPRSWAKLQKCRELDHRLLFDFERRLLSLVDLQQLEEHSVWIVPFEETSLEVKIGSSGGGQLGVRLDDQDEALPIASWPEKRSDESVLRLGECLAKRMGVDFYKIRDFYRKLDDGKYERATEKTQIC